MKRTSFMIYILAAIYITILSYGFLDLNLSLTNAAPIANYLILFRSFAREHRPMMAMLWLFGLGVFSVCYLSILKTANDVTKSSYKFIGICIAMIALILSFAYPANSYDLFNYITTAKVTFHYRENPYIVMPVEFTGEPYLAFTRAANKVALYGPVWIFITSIPHLIGAGNIWSTIVAFKLLNASFYLLFLYSIFRITGSVKNILFFAFNPLVLLEVIVSGHNDIYMMVLALVGLNVWWHKKKITGFLFFALSWFIKGMTISLIPLLFMSKKTWEQILSISYWIVLIVFLVVAPIREELYPWYAVWSISIASLMNFTSNTFIYAMTIVLSISLELRHVPYMWMGYYEGPGPMLRTLVTLIPPIMFILIYLFKQYKQCSPHRI